MYVCMHVYCQRAPPQAGALDMCIHLSIYLSTYLSIYLSIYLSVYLNMYVCMYAYIYTAPQAGAAPKLDPPNQTPGVRHPN